MPREIAEPALDEQIPAEQAEEVETAADGEQSTTEHPGEESQPGESGEQAEGAEKQDDAEPQDGQESPEKQPASRGDKRFAELTRKLHESDEAKAAAEAKAADAEAKAKQYEELAPQNLPLPIRYVTPAEAKAIDEANRAEAEEAHLLEYVGTGYTDPNDESKNLTAQQVGRRIAELRRDAPKHMQTRQLYEARYRQFMEDSKTGFELRTKAKAPAAARPQPKPVAAVRPTQTGGAPISARQKSGMNSERFTKNGGTRQAAIFEMSQL